MILLHEHFVIDVDVWGYDCEVRLNGYGLHTPWRGPFRGVVSVNHWILPGENTLEIAVQGVESDLPPAAEPMDSDDESADTSEPKPSRWVRACVAVEHDVMQGAFAGESEGEVLADIGLDLTTIDESDLPGVMSASFECAATRPHWRWQEAKAFEEALTEDETAEFAAFVQHLRDCVERGDLDATMQQLEPTLIERAKAYEQTPAGLVSAVKGEYASLFAGSGLSLAKNSLDDLVPHMHCGGRVIEVTDRNGQPFIRQAASGQADGDWNMPLFVGAYGGNWSVLSV